MSVAKKSEVKLLQRAYKYVFGLTSLFLATAVFAAIVGKQLDKRLAIEPWGSVAAFGVCYSLTWIIGHLALKKFNQKVDSTHVNNSR